MILANGCPKSGTHALMRLLATRGLTRLPGIGRGYEPGHRMKIDKTKADPEPISWPLQGNTDRFFLHGHVVAGVDVRGADVVTIIRDPRNVLLSYMRDQKVDAWKALDDFCGHQFVPLYRRFLKWREGGAIVLRYEEIDPAWLDETIDLYPNSQYSPDTYRMAHVDWRVDSAADINNAWRYFDGPQLVADAGYEAS